MSDVDDLGRRVDLLAGEIRDLVRWLREEQSERLKAIEENIVLHRRYHAEADKRITDLRVDMIGHAKRIAALEAAKKKGKRT